MGMKDARTSGSTEWKLLRGKNDGEGKHVLKKCQSSKNHNASVQKTVQNFIQWTLMENFTTQNT